VQQLVIKLWQYQDARCNCGKKKNVVQCSTILEKHSAFTFRVIQPKHWDVATTLNTWILTNATVRIRSFPCDIIYIHTSVYKWSWVHRIFAIHVTMHRVIFLIIKPIRCTNFSNLFLEWDSTCFGQFFCPISGVFHCTHSNGICHTGLLTACEQDQDGTPSWSCSHIPLLCVQWKNVMCYNQMMVAIVDVLTSFILYLQMITVIVPTIATIIWL
jgi:hypothetical protein